MPSTNFYNHNDHTAFPFIDNGGAPVSGRGVADAGFVMGVFAEFSPQLHRVYLHAITRTGSALVFDFRSDAPGFSAHYFRFTRTLTSPFGTTEYVEAQEVANPSPVSGLHGNTEAEYGFAFLVTGDLSVYSSLPQGQSVFTTALIEPACVQSLADTYVTSITIANDERRCPLRTAPSGPAKTFVNKEGIVGDVKFMEGSNCVISIDVTGNAIVLDGQIGYGAGKTCHDILIDEDGIVIGGTCDSCEGYIHSINGVGVAESTFTIEVGSGLTVKSYPTTHVVEILLGNVKACET